MQTYQCNNEMVWYNADLLTDPPELCTNAPYWYVQNKVIGSAKGRGTTWFVQLDKLQGALRHYRRGGLFGKLVKDHYRFTRWEATRSYQEYLLLMYLKEAGVNVPTPIAARAIKKNFCYQADLLSEKILNAKDLISILKGTALSVEMYKKIGTEIRKMHDAQVNHTDLNIHNILIDDQNQVWIIDFDKCYQQDGAEWKVENINRLKRSFIKEVKKSAIHWDANEYVHLLEGYNPN